MNASHAATVAEFQEQVKLVRDFAQSHPTSPEIVAFVRTLAPNDGPRQFALHALALRSIKP